MPVAGPPVSIAVAEARPTDNAFPQGASRADVDAALASLAANPRPGAGGSAPSLVPPSQHTAPLPAAPLHGLWPAPPRAALAGC